MHCRIMGNNEKKTVIIKFPRFFARFSIVLVQSHCFMFCQLNFFTEIAVNFHKIFNQTGVGGSDSVACQNVIYQLQILLAIFRINYCHFSVKLTTLLYLLFDEFLFIYFYCDTCDATQIRHLKMELLKR